MAPGAGQGILDQKHFERQMGCIGGLLNLFDRQQIVARKRLPHRLQSTSPSERSDASSVSAAFVRESLNRSPPPDNHAPPTPSHPLPLLEVKNVARSSPKHRETLLLSLENRAGGDDKAKLRSRVTRELASFASPSSQSDASEAAEESERQRRSPSVVARLMGLDALPDSAADGGGTESGRSELRWSASESRVPKYTSFSRLLDEGTFPKRSPVEASPVSFDGLIRMPSVSEISLPGVKKPKSPSKTSFLPPIQRKSFFEADDFFPDPKRRGLLPIELDKRHLMRGMDEAARDLETLKQILEALQLKGLLCSKPHDDQVNGTRDHSRQSNNRFADYSPIVVIEPAPSPFRRPSSELHVQMPPKIGTGRRTLAEEATIHHVRQTRRVDQNPTANNENKSRAPNLLAKRRTPNVTDSDKCPPPRRRISAANPPPQRICPSPVSGQPLPNRRPKQEVTTPKRRLCAQAGDNTDIAEPTPAMDERSWAEDYRAGRQLLERCDRLLRSIAAFTAPEQVTVASEPAAATAEQPSPISVLDTNILGEESSPRSPVSKRSLAFEGVQLTEHEEEAIASISEESPDAPEEMAVVMENDDDYVYVGDILRASDSYDDETDVYTLLEKSRGAVSDAPAPKSTHLHRRLIFDAVAEILDQKRCASPPPWESFVRPGSLSTCIRLSSTTPLLPEVWAELRRAQEHVSADDVDAVTCLAAGRGLAREYFIDSWARPATEVADAAIQIERQIFKELVDGTIRDLADACVVVLGAAAISKPRPRRKLAYPRVP